ncbi:MAG: MFS transporter [Spirochaetes bacterium]|nr:MFS transporter [Spirochaetota bacterium]
MNKERLWTRDFISTAIINFLVAMVFFLLMVTLAPYAINEYQASTSAAGLVSGIFIIGALLGRLIIGPFIEDIGSKKILMISLIFFIFTSALYFGAVNLSLLLINRFLHGMAFGAVTISTGTIIAKIVPVNRRGEGIGYFSMSTLVATAIGPFLGIFLSQLANFKIIFILNLVLALLCLAMSFFISSLDVKPDRPGIPVNAAKNFHISGLLEPRVIPISIISLVISFSYSGVLSFLSFYAKQINLVEAARWFFLVYALAIFISRPFSGRIFDVKGANIVIYPCLFIFAFGMVLLSQANSGIILLLAGAIIGLGFGNYISCAQAISIKVAPPNRLGLATSTYFIFFDFGFGIGPYLFGILLQFSGFRELYFTAAIVILCAVVFYYFLYGRKAALE